MKIEKQEILFKGKIFEVVRQKVIIDNKNREFELINRSPGVRLIIKNNDKILLTKEFRYEYNDFDYRLPGGKVFNRLEEYKKTKSEDLLEHAYNAAKKECIEETGLIPKKIEHLHTNKAGATIYWDLYYFLIQKFETSEQKLEHGEHIKPEWFTYEQVRDMSMDKKIKEDRSVAVLLRYLADFSKK